MMNPSQSLGPRNTGWPSTQEAVSILLADPGRCLRGPCETEYDWEILNNMHFSVRGRGMVYVEGISIARQSDVVKIHKFAVESDVLRLGIGRAMVHWLAEEFQSRFSAAAIEFEQENDTSYPSFYRNIGAIAVPGPWTNKPGWSSWVWRFDSLVQSKAVPR